MRIVFLLLTLLSINAFAAVEVGFIAGLTGTDPNTARELGRGVEVFEKAHPDARQMMKINILDNQGSPEKTLMAMDELYKKGVRIFIGVSSSNEAIAAAKFVAEKKDSLFITPFATNPKVTEYSDRVFRTCFDDVQQGEFLARYVSKQFKGKRVAVFTNSSSHYSQGLSSVFMKNISGITAKNFEYTSVAPDPGALRAEIAAFKPDLAFIPDSAQSAAQIAKLVFEIDRKTQFLGGDGMGGIRLFHAVLPITEDLKVQYTTYWHAEIQTRENKAFMKIYKKLFPKDNPSSGAALTYEAFGVLFQALKNAKSTSVRDLVHAIRSKPYAGTTGNLKFDAYSGTPKRSVVLMSLGRDGEYHPSVETAK